MRLNTRRINCTKGTSSKTPSKMIHTRVIQWDDLHNSHPERWSTQESPSEIIHTTVTQLDDLHNSHPMRRSTEVTRWHDLHNSHAVHASLTFYFCVCLFAFVQSLRLCISGIESQQLAHPLKFQLMDMLQPAQPHRLATKKCSYGPSYWCASVANANECGVRLLATVSLWLHWKKKEKDNKDNFVHAQPCSQSHGRLHNQTFLSALCGVVPKGLLTFLGFFYAMRSLVPVGHFQNMSGHLFNWLICGSFQWRHRLLYTDCFVWDDKEKVIGFKRSHWIHFGWWSTGFSKL